MWTSPRPKLYVDIETYSATNLKKSGVYRYAEDPDFQILMAAYADEMDAMLGIVHVAVGEDEIKAIPGLWDDTVLKVAHNASFERVCFSRLAGLPVGEYLDPSTYDDSMVLGAQWGYPRSLDALAKALGAEEKDSAGTALINFFCSPDRKGQRRLPEDHPEKWAQFIEYCRQDVATLVDVYERLMDRHGGWPTTSERNLWLDDQRINDQGITVDTGMAAAAVESDQQNRTEQMAEMRAITGAANPRSIQQLQAWFNSTGLKVPNFRAETVTMLLDSPSKKLTDAQRRILELRQETALAASAKYSAALERVSADGQLRGSFQFFGAHTGRWAGRGVQLQNLPSATFASKDDVKDAKAAGADEDVLDAMVKAHADAARLDLALGTGGSAHTLKALVRAMFVGPFTVVDYSAIEARVIAWLAGETWALDAFRAGRDIYVETAARMFNLNPVEALERRKDGKVAVLGLGYNGGVGALRVMGAQGSDSQLQSLVTQYRNANANITSFWSELEGAFKRGKGATAGDHIRVESEGRTRYVVLPSGRAITYHNCKSILTEGPYGPVSKITFADPGKAGARTYTYGGRLAENVTQAVARDLLGQAILNLSNAGYEVVGHVHDEILVTGGATVEEVSKLMTENPPWSTGLPLNAEGFITERYRKG